MSKWHEVFNEDDVSISEDGKTLEIKFDTDHNGNIWVEIPLAFIEQKALNAVSEFVLMEQLSRREYSASKMCEVINDKIEQIKNK